MLITKPINSQLCGHTKLSVYVEHRGREPKGYDPSQESQIHSQATKGQVRNIIPTLVHISLLVFFWNTVPAGFCNLG